MYKWACVCVCVEYRVPPAQPVHSHSWFMPTMYFIASYILHMQDAFNCCCSIVVRIPDHQHPAAVPPLYANAKKTTIMRLSGPFPNRNVICLVVSASASHLLRFIHFSVANANDHKNEHRTEQMESNRNGEIIVHAANQHTSHVTVTYICMCTLCAAVQQWCYYSGIYGRCNVLLTCAYV